jgi:hypothetical protein
VLAASQSSSAICAFGLSASDPGEDLALACGEVDLVTPLLEQDSAVRFLDRQAAAVAEV